MMRKKDKSGIASHSILLMLVNVMTTLLGVIVTKLLSVHFSLEEYGTYSQALLINSTVANLSIMGLTDATNYFYNRIGHVADQRKYISTIFTTQYLVGMGCAAAVILFKDWIATYFHNEHLSGYLLVVALTPLLNNLIAMYQRLFVSIGQAKRLAVRTLFVAGIRLMAVVAACFLVKNIILVLIVVFVLDAGQVLYFHVMFRHERFAVSVRDADFSVVKEILGFSIPMAVYVLTNSLSRDIDKYVIGALSNTETLAVYSNAAKLLPFDLLTSALLVVLVPVITRSINQKKTEDARKVFSQYLRLGVLTTSTFVGGAIALAKYVMCFLYDEKYLPGLNVFVIYLVIDMLRFANVTTVLSGAGKTKTLMHISVMTLLANLVFNIVGYRLWGMIGPALVTLVLTVGMTLALLSCGAHVLNTTIPGLFDLKEISIVGAEIIGCGIVIHYLSQILESQAMPLFLNLGISYGVYLLLMFGMNYKRVIDCFRQLNAYK